MSIKTMKENIKAIMSENQNMRDPKIDYKALEKEIKELAREGQVSIRPVNADLKESRGYVKDIQTLNEFYSIVEVSHSSDPSTLAFRNVKEPIKFEDGKYPEIAKIVNADINATDARIVNFTRKIVDALVDEIKTERKLQQAALAPKENNFGLSFSASPPTVEGAVNLIINTDLPTVEINGKAVTQNEREAFNSMKLDDIIFKEVEKLGFKGGVGASEEQNEDFYTVANAIAGHLVKEYKKELKGFRAVKGAMVEEVKDDYNKFKETANQNDSYQRKPIQTSAGEYKAILSDSYIPYDGKLEVTEKEIKKLMNKTIENTKFEKMFNSLSTSGTLQGVSLDTREK